MFACTEFGVSVALQDEKSEPMYHRDICQYRQSSNVWWYRVWCVCINTGREIRAHVSQRHLSVPAEQQCLVVQCLVCLYHSRTRDRSPCTTETYVSTNRAAMFGCTEFGVSVSIQDERSEPMYHRDICQYQQSSNVWLY